VGYIKEVGLKIDAKTARGRANQLKGHLNKIALKYGFEEAEAYEIDLALDDSQLRLKSYADDNDVIRSAWIVSWEGAYGWAGATEENIFGAYDGLDYELYCGARDALKLTTYPSNGFAWDLTQKTFDWVGIEAGIDYDADGPLALIFYPSN
jgi:hypothetical protein